MYDWEKILTLIVNINSGTQNTDGSEAVRQALIPEFKKLGFEVKEHDVGERHKVLCFEVNGGKQDILYMGHLDTVFPKGHSFSALTKDGNKLRGPGVIDMKGGVVLILALLAELKAELSDTDYQNTCRRIRVMLNDDEEIGSVYSRQCLKKLADGIAYGLVLEPGLDDGTVVTAHSGVRWLELKVKGKPAHAGSNHEDGVNACVELCRKVSQIADLTDYNRKLTVNAGLISGGTAANVVCDFASATFDIRYVDKNDFDEALKKIDKITSTMSVHSKKLNLSPTAEVSLIAEFPSMPESSSAKLFKIAQEAGHKVGQTVRGSWVGYASDANHLAETGMQCLVGLGPYGGGMHTSQEFLDIASFSSRLALNKEILNALLAKPHA